MFQLDYSDRRPLYEQIKSKIRELIISGALAEHEKIPSVRELAVTLAINPNTIQKAYRDLEAEGYIYSQRSKGSFVSPRAEGMSGQRADELKYSLGTVLHELKFLGVTKDEIMNEINKYYE